MSVIINLKVKIINVTILFSNKYFNCCKNTSHKKLLFIELGKLIFLYEITGYILMLQ